MVYSVLKHGGREKSNAGVASLFTFRRGQPLPPLPPSEAIGEVPKKRARQAFPNCVTPLRPPHELAEGVNLPRNNHILAIWLRYLAGGV